MSTLRLYSNFFASFKCVLAVRSISWFRNRNIYQIKCSFPVDWLVNYLQNKPEVIRYMVDHLLDHNGDGQVTSQELITSLQQRED